MFAVVPGDGTAGTALLTELLARVQVWATIVIGLARWYGYHWLWTHDQARPRCSGLFVINVSSALC